MKMIKSLNMNTSVYAGKKKSFVEYSMKPSQKTDPTTGEVLPPSKRYYVIRPLSFEHGDRTDYPFIIRDEHVIYQRNAEGKVVNVEKICCSKTPWANQQLLRQGEPVGKGYCPICEFSFAKNKLAWANKPNVDRVAEKLCRETKSVWAAYLPIFVVNDPHYSANNQHLRVLRITDKEGFTKIVRALEDALNKGTSVFNGEMGANTWILVEEVKKNRLDKNGNVAMNKKTGKPYEFTSWEITDVRVATKKLYEYPQITDAAIDELHFDDTYGVASNRSALETFLRKNWLDIGASDSDFDDAFDAPAAETTNEAATEKASIETDAEPEVVQVAQQSTESADDEFDGEVSSNNVQSASNGDDSVDADIDEDASVNSVISGIIGTSTVNKTVGTASADSAKKTVARKTQMMPSAETVRAEVASGIPSYDDLPF